MEQTVELGRFRKAFFLHASRYNLYSEETLEKVINVFDRQNYQRANGYILVSSKSFEGDWDVDCDAKVIESNSDDWKKYFK